MAHKRATRRAQNATTNVGPRHASLSVDEADEATLLLLAPFFSLFPPINLLLDNAKGYWLKISSVPGYQGLAVFNSVLALSHHLLAEVASVFEVGQLIRELFALVAQIARLRLCWLDCWNLDSKQWIVAKGVGERSSVDLFVQV